MKREPQILLGDIFESIVKIEEYTKKYTQESFSNDAKTQDAVTRRLEIIGEAVKNLPVEFRQKHPTIEWKKIAGMRDIITHAYFGIEVERVWLVLKNDLEKLKADIEKIKKKM